jgi:hypothetical protein
MTGRPLLRITTASHLADVFIKGFITLISPINVEVGINVEGMQKLQNQKMWRLEYCSKSPLLLYLNS